MVAGQVGQTVPQEARPALPSKRQLADLVEVRARMLEGSPVRKKDTNRSSPRVHDEDPDLKVVIRDDGADENANENIDMKDEATHIDIGSLGESRPNADGEVLTGARILGDLPDPHMVMSVLSSLDNYVIICCLLVADVSECAGRD